MTTADRTAADALARHFAFAEGGWWEHLNDREQAVYRARALDVVQVVGPIYQAPPTIGEPVHRLAVLALQSGDRELHNAGCTVLDRYTPTFPRPRGCDR